MCTQGATCAGVFVNSLATCSRGRCHTGTLAGLNKKRDSSVCTTPAEPATRSSKAQGWCRGAASWQQAGIAGDLRNSVGCCVRIRPGCRVFTVMLLLAGSRLASSYVNRQLASLLWP